MIGSMLFGAPFALLALLLIPLIWLLLRSLPPPRRRQRFPPLRLLRDAVGSEELTESTPLWLRLLRTAAILAAIFGFADPSFGPEKHSLVRSGPPVLIVVDGSWASAADWPKRLESVETLLDSVASAGRPVAVVVLASPDLAQIEFLPAGVWKRQLSELVPFPWEPPEPDSISQWLPDRIETFWVSDGLERPMRKPLARELAARGDLRIYENPADIVALSAPAFASGRIQIPVLQTPKDESRSVIIDVIGTGPSGLEGLIESTTKTLSIGEASAVVEFLLPPEVRSRVKRFEIRGGSSAAKIAFAGDQLARRRTALVGSRINGETKELLAGSHYLRAALEPVTELSMATFDDALEFQPDILVLDDIAGLPTETAQQLDEWVRNGGTLLRFAGANMALGRIPEIQERNLLPVPLRAGGRLVGGALSWSEPQRIRPFVSDSPFHGLEIPEQLEVRAQLLPRHDSGFSESMLASLIDGTPLVTGRRSGEGQLIFFHLSADAEWSDLPLTGLFVEMLERIVSRTDASPRALTQEEQQKTWFPIVNSDAFGKIVDPAPTGKIIGKRLSGSVSLPGTAPGIYQSGDEVWAVNAIAAERQLERAKWPSDVSVSAITDGSSIELKPVLLTTALVLLLFDVVATLFLSGRFRRSEPYKI